MKHTIVRQGDEYFCIICHRRWGIEESVPFMCEKISPPKHVRKSTPDQLIGFMAAKLAIYEPNSLILKEALEYLKKSS